LGIIRCGSVSFPAIAAVVFDKDGTLADSQNFLCRLGHKRIQYIAEQIGGLEASLLRTFGLKRDRVDPAGLLAVGTRTENEIAAAACIAETGRAWMAALAIARSAFLAADQAFHRKADSTPLFPGALDLLQRLSAYQIKLAIVSSDSPVNVQDFVDRYQLNSLITVSLGSELGLSKPHPALLAKACQQLGVLPAHTLVIGDSQADVELTLNGGAAGCVGVAWGWTAPSSLRGADAIAQSFADIHIDSFGEC